MRKRDTTIDIVKCLAVLLIINSHADVMYPHLKSLTTGGAIGDCLFLFCSGFTLLIGKKNAGFGNYYKRRISRIYPSVFASVAFLHILNGNGMIRWTELLCSMPFIVAIMIYYVFLFYIKKYAYNHIPLVIIMMGVISLLVYLFCFPYKNEIGINGMYGNTTIYRWIPYFCAMLIGAYMGVNRDKISYPCKTDFIKLILCILFFYGIQYGAKHYPPIAPWQVVTLIPLMGIVYYVYKCCNAAWLQRVYATKKGRCVILGIGGLCLESYLIQFSLFTDKMNSIWPLNLVIIVLVILICSYIVRCIARLFAQTFRTEDYEWRKIFSLY